MRAQKSHVHAPPAVSTECATPVAAERKARRRGRLARELCNTGQCGTKHELLKVGAPLVRESASVPPGTNSPASTPGLTRSGLVPRGCEEPPDPDRSVTTVQLDPAGARPHPSASARRSGRPGDPSTRGRTRGGHPQAPTSREAPQDRTLPSYRNRPTKPISPNRAARPRRTKATTAHLRRAEAAGRQSTITKRRPTPTISPKVNRPLRRTSHSSYGSP